VTGATRPVTLANEEDVSRLGCQEYNLECERMADLSIDVIRGTLDLLILKTPSHGPT